MLQRRWELFVVEVGGVHPRPKGFSWLLAGVVVEVAVYQVLGWKV
jgi:hypothetical protein